MWKRVGWSSGGQRGEMGRLRTERAARRWGGCAGNQEEGTERAIRRQAAGPHPEAGVAWKRGGRGGVARSKKRLGEPLRCRLCVGWVLPCSAWLQSWCWPWGSTVPPWLWRRAYRSASPGWFLPGFRKSLSQGPYFYTGTTPSPAAVPWLDLD